MNFRAFSLLLFIQRTCNKFVDLRFVVEFRQLIIPLREILFIFVRENIVDIVKFKKVFLSTRGSI